MGLCVLECDSAGIYFAEGPSTHGDDGEMFGLTGALERSRLQWQIKLAAKPRSRRHDSGGGDRGGRLGSLPVAWRMR